MMDMGLLGIQAKVSWLTSISRADELSVTESVSKQLTKRIHCDSLVCVRPVQSSAMTSSKSDQTALTLEPHHTSTVALCAGLRENL